MMGMESRRRAILGAARQMLAAGGVDGLNLRDLARTAGVTVPTVYNLVGNKEEIFVALYSAILDEVGERISARTSDPLALAEALTVEVADLFAGDESYYRSAFLAIDHVHRIKVAPPSVGRLYRRGERLLAAGIAACSAAQLLRGRIAAKKMVALVSHAFNENLRDWAAGLATIERFRSAALADLYIALAADAVETFHARLVAKLAALDADTILRRTSHEA
jgi:AcrR family transcriptional regulator